MIETHLRVVGDEDLARQAEALIEEARRRQRRRHRRIAAVLVVLVGLVAGGLLVARADAHRAPAGGPAPAPMSGTGHWHTTGATLWQHGQPGNDPGLGSPTSVTCAPSGSATCYVVLQANGVRPDGAPVEPGVVPGFSPLLSSLYRSADGGSTWTAVRLPAGAWLSTPLACQGPSTCEAGAVIDAGISPGSSGTAVVLATTDGGRTWARRPLPAEVALVTRLACPSAARCVALTWAHGSPVIDGVEPSVGFERFNPTSVLTTADGGRHWSVTALPGGVPGTQWSLSSVACPTTTRCVLLGERADIVDQPNGYVQQDHELVALVSNDGGRTLDLAAERPGLSPGTVACGGAAACLAIAQGAGGSPPVVLRSTDGGRSWATVGTSGLPARAYVAVGQSLACPSSTTCLLPTIAGIATSHDGGRNWRVVDTFPPLPRGYSTHGVTQISCVASGACLALDDMTHGMPVEGPPSNAVGTRVLSDARGS